MNNKQKVFILFLLLLSMFFINYNFLDQKVESFFSDQDIIYVDRVIDGDTIVSNDTSIRLLGINTPERGEYYYGEAKEFLENLILNESVKLVYGQEKTDKYGRTLAYVFYDEENINVKMVEEGYANYYFYEGKDIYSGDLEKAWINCIQNGINLCELSGDICSSCISVSLENIQNECEFSCDIKDWMIKGEGRDKIIFEKKILNPGERTNFTLDLSNSGRTLFLRDSEGKLIFWGIF